MSNDNYHMVHNTRAEAVHFVASWWSYRHDSPRHFKLVREALADIRAANELIGK